MNEITIITPPDFLLNDAFTLLIVCPSNSLKDVLHNTLINSESAINAMIYETPEDDIHQINWLLTATKTADCIIIDLDNCDALTKQFASHIIAQPQTFYLTKDMITPYNLISKGRVYDLTWLEHFINRGTNEQTL